MADLTFWDKALNSGAEHWPLLAGIAVLLAFGGFYLLKYGIPGAVKLTLMNGSGEVVRQIIRDENSKQSDHHKSETREIVKQEIAEHALEELKNMQELVDDMFARLNRQRRKRR